jgi:hypothetical protein
LLNHKQEADVVVRGGLDKRLADLDAMGVDMQVIKPPPPQCPRYRREGITASRRRADA